MDTKCERYAFFKRSILKIVMVVVALSSGGIFACYHLKFGQLPLEEIRQYFLLKNEGVTLSEFGLIFMDYAKYIVIMIFLNIFGYLKYMGKLFVMGVLFGYGYIMTALYASMRIGECIPFIFILAIQGGILTSFMMELCKRKETVSIRQNANILMEDVIKGTVVCVCVTILNLISHINIIK